jgi:hypothetical protein
MIVAQVAVELYLLTESSRKVLRFAEMSAEILIPLLPEGVCYQLVKQGSTYRWDVEQLLSLHQVCFPDLKTWLLDVPNWTHLMCRTVGEA